MNYTTTDDDPFTPPYGDIHHRSETLRGIADGELLLLWAPSPRWRLGLGTTLPFGSTVEDPVALGRAGLKHEHLQFGTGVFAPQAEIAWNRPMRGGATFSALLQATIPMSTNSRGFAPPKNFRWSLGPSFNIRRVDLALSAAGQHQTIGRWNGEIDEGTGFTNFGLRAQLFVPVRGLTIAPSVYRELYSHGHHSEDHETFSQGTTLGVTLSRTF